MTSLVLLVPPRRTKSCSFRKQTDAWPCGGRAGGEGEASERRPPQAAHGEAGRTSGLEHHLRGDLEPWLCYYCGECSDQCPREAEPGETMMAMRRWLTSKYDFTGISKLFYRSWKAELAGVLLLAVLTGAGFLYYGLVMGGGSLDHYDAPGAFLPSSAVHIFDWCMAAVLTSLLVVNSIRMWWFSMMGEHGPKLSLFSYIKNAVLLP